MDSISSNPNQATSSKYERKLRALQIFYASMTVTGAVLVAISLNLLANASLDLARLTEQAQDTRKAAARATRWFGIIVILSSTGIYLSATHQDEITENLTKAEASGSFNAFALGFLLLPQITMLVMVCGVAQISAILGTYGFSDGLYAMLLIAALSVMAMIPWVRKFPKERRQG